MSLQQTPTQQIVVPVPVSLHTLPAGTHLCQVYQMEEEREAVLASFWAEGMERREQCLYIKATGNDAAQSWIGNVNIFVPAEVWGGNGRFHLDKARTWLQKKRQEAVRQGYTGLRLATDMGWCLPLSIHEASLIAYKTQFEHSPAAHNVAILSQFNQNDFPLQVLVKLLSIHDYVGIGRYIYTNPFVISPIQLAAPLYQEWRGYQQHLDQIQSWIGQDNTRPLSSPSPTHDRVTQLLSAEREQRLLAETLAEVTLALVSHTSYDEVLEEILHQAERLVPYQSANIALVEGDTLRVVRWRGYDVFGGEPFIAHFTQSLQEKSISAEVIQSGQSCMIDDTRHDDRWFFANGMEWIRSYLVMPISLRQQVIGVLRLSSRQVKGFSLQDNQRLQPLANAAAIAMTNAQLHYQAQQEIAERKQIEQALRESERRFAIATKAGRTGVWDWDLVNERLHFESILHGLLGYEEGEFQWEQNSWAQLIHPEDLPHLRSTWQRCLKGEIPEVDISLRLWHQNGSLLWVLLRGEVVYNKQDHLAGLAGTVTDITAAKQTEIQLQQLSQAVEQSPVSIVITNLRGEIEYVNPKFTAVTGYTAAEVLGQNPRILKTGHTSPAEYQVLWQTILQGRVWRGEFKNRTKDGRIYWEKAVISPIKNKNGDITHFVAVKEDITNIREMTNTLYQRNRELQLLNRAGQDLNSTLTLDRVLHIMLEEIRNLLNVVACSVWLLDEDTGDLVCRQVTDPQGDIVRGWRLQSGQGIAGQAALQGKSIIVPDALQDDRHYKAIDQKTKLHIHSILTVPLRTKQDIIGVFQVVDEQVDRFTTNDLELMESLAAVAANAIENARLHENLQQQLITLQNTQQQLIQHEKLAAVGELAAGVAHEINNPLTSINLYINLLQRKALANETRQELNKIQQQTRQAASIVRSLLDFARQHPPERTPTQVNDLVTGVLELLAYQLRAQKIEWQTQLHTELPLAQVDSRQILQVLVNLINNAVHAMQGNAGRRLLLVTTEVGSSHFAQLPVNTAEQYIRIAIQDNGAGIPDDFQSRIFDPFFTTKPPGEGTGLGLSVCHGIVSEHEGHIWAQSTPGEGAAFFVELPVTPLAMGKENRDDTTTVGTTPATAQPRILLIDDEDSVRAILSRALSRENYQVDSVDDGETGLAYVQQNDYNIIICDMHMPQMDGIAVYKQLQAQHPHLLPRFIFTTGDASSEVIRLFLQETGAPHLSKPFDLISLKQVIEATLRALPPTS